MDKEQNILKKKNHGMICNTCAGEAVVIRGKYPGFEKRVICPTCAYERLESIHEMSSDTYEVAYSDKEKV